MLRARFASRLLALTLLAVAAAAGAQPRQGGTLTIVQGAEPAVLVSAVNTSTFIGTVSPAGISKVMLEEISCMIDSANKCFDGYNRSHSKASDQTTNFHVDVRKISKWTSVSSRR